MARYRECLPQTPGNVFLTDGGLETNLTLHDGLDLPEFAAFPLLANPTGHRLLENYYRRYVNTSLRNGCGLILESPTWRASQDWAARLKISARDLVELNKLAIKMLVELRNQHETTMTPMVLTGSVGPRRDGYHPTTLMTELDAQDYHSAQIEILSQTQADLISATAMSYAAEAIGIARAAKAANMPSVISFNVESDGCLPSGQPLKEAVLEVDYATDQAPMYYMINFARSDRFLIEMPSGANWLDRIGGIRSSATRMSNGQLVRTDDANPMELGRFLCDLRSRLRNLKVFGGCCEAHHGQVAQICRALTLQSHANAA